MGQHLLIWASAVFFNMGAIALEGAFFVPELAPIPIPLLAVQQFVAAGTAGLLITLLFAQRGQTAGMADAVSRRPWFAWLWRIALASASYLLFYLLQTGMLPPLLLASGVEILLQNFLTGVVAAALLWIPAEHRVAVEPGPHQRSPVAHTTIDQRSST